MVKQKLIQNLKIVFIFLAVLFTIPSIFYFIQNKTVYSFNENLEFYFLLTTNINRIIQTIIYFIIVTLMVIVYYYIIKNRQKLFKNIKQIYLFIIIVSIVFLFVIPFWCSDVFYYLGIGRLGVKYNQNPYYENIKNFVDNNNIDLQKDTVIR